MPYLIDASCDYRFFKVRLDKVIQFKESDYYSDLTKVEKALVNEQISALETLVTILKKRINLY